MKGAKDKLSKATRAAYDEVRQYVPYVDVDRESYVDIHKAEAIIKTNKIVEAVEKIIGGLH